MTKHREEDNCCMGPGPEGRKRLMRIMAEVRFNPGSINPEQQEDLAEFMVQQLRGNSCNPGGTIHD